MPYRIGQMFSIDGSNARPTMRYCITPEPPQRCEAAYAAALTVLECERRKTLTFQHARLADDVADA